MAQVLVPTKTDVSSRRPVAVKRSPDWSAAYRLSSALAVVAAATTALTFFVPDVLRGPAAMNGSGRGTALVALVLGVPVLVAAMLATVRGSVGGSLFWLGAVAYLFYQSVLLLFMTPFNSLFLLYCAMLSLSIWSIIAISRALDAAAVAARFEHAVPVRPIAGFLWVVAVLNAAAWLAEVVPALFSGGRPEFLEGTGLGTNPVYVQDLSFWIPLTSLAAWWLWQRWAWGYVTAGALLVFFVIENITIAVDQYLGSAADPASPMVSDALTPVFALLALVSAIPLYVFMRNVRGRTQP